MSAYLDFLAAKTRHSAQIGITGDFDLHPALFPFQRDLVAWALRQARAAIFADTGLGKTLMELAWADVIADFTGRPVLILTPLAVAHQIVADAKKFGVEDVAYAKSQADVASRIVVSNYDRLGGFDMDAFGGVALDESSIIKSHDSKTRAALIARCRGMAFKLACTATPAPNDWTELGNHAELLEVLSEKEMLATFFVHDGSVRAHGDNEWRLKGHAVGSFWAWVASWAAMIRSPADLGYDDARYMLPPLIKHQVTVRDGSEPEAGSLFVEEARTLQQRLSARRDSVSARAAAAAGIVNAAPDRPWLIWCHLNAEADALAELIADAVEVRGPDKEDVKTGRLLGFCSGSPRILLTKPSIAGWGMNWQHCSDMVFVGLSDSFEQVYQAIRRCWRFGQTKPVNVYMIASEREGAVVANLDAKEAAFAAMGAAMAVHMRDLTRRHVQGDVALSAIPQHSTMELPQWLAA